MKSIYIFVIIVLSVIAMSCNNNETTETKADTNAVDSRENAKNIKPTFSAVDASLTQHVQLIVSHYIHVKTALVNDNSAEAKNGAEMILSAATNFDASHLPEDQKAEYSKSVTELKNSVDSIAKASDIEQQRTSFASLSGSVYALLKAFGASQHLYHDYCPMAMDNKGAMWLSEVKEIKNPYFGNKMLECGSVEEIIHK